MSYVGRKFVAKPRRIFTEEEASRTMMEYGVVYEAEITFDRTLDPNRLAEFVFLAISELKKKHPGVTVNYVEVKGNKVIIQYYDEEVKPAIPVWVATIIIAAAVCVTTAALVWGAEKVSVVVKDLGKFIAELPEPVKWSLIISGVVLSVGVSALLVAILVRALRKLLKK